MPLLLIGMGLGGYLWNKVDDKLFDEPQIIENPVISNQSLLIGVVAIGGYFIAKKQGWI